MKSFSWIPEWKIVAPEYSGPRPKEVVDYNDLINYVNVFVKHAKGNPDALAGDTRVEAEIL